ncbi:hypothetical protein AB0D86_12425 [Streptomyces sp. NPDC048324]|uniref:hypothetical protein n=1 Tax=Streptomyces sp. NPDC048324 TaxID=3157205 RepID=UPI003432B3D8
MDIAHHIALVEELCFRPFAAGHAHHEAELAVSHGLRGGDLAERAVTAEQYRKDRDALYDRLASRWGETEPYNLQTVLLRSAEEEIPGPWASLSARADVAYLWEVTGTARWVALAVADRDVGDEVQLLAVVTEVAPP